MTKKEGEARAPGLCCATKWNCSEHWLVHCANPKALEYLSGLKWVDRLDWNVVHTPVTLDFREPPEM